MRTIFSWLKVEIISRNQKLIAINWKNFLLFPISLYKINKLYFLCYLFYLYLFFCLDTTKFARLISQNQDGIVFFAFFIETFLRLLFLPIILYFCIDKNKIISKTEMAEVNNYKTYLFIPLSFLVLLSYDFGLIVFV